MSELRAPDPTLDNYIPDVGIDFGQRVLVAHRLDDRHCGGASEGAMPGPVYAYTAVACRECFPDAPPPGHYSTCSGPCVMTDVHPYLSWQVRP